MDNRDENRHTSDNLPVRPDTSDLSELEPHQQTIEQVARVYYESCRQMARGIRTVKNWLSERDKK